MLSEYKEDIEKLKMEKQEVKKLFDVYYDKKVGVLYSNIDIVKKIIIDKFPECEIYKTEDCGDIFLYIKDKTIFDNPEFGKLYLEILNAGLLLDICLTYED